jgi:hypothetical protein
MLRGFKNILGDGSGDFQKRIPISRPSKISDDIVKDILASCGNDGNDAGE